MAIKAKKVNALISEVGPSRYFLVGTESGCRPGTVYN
jgi:hypothetical protein